MKKKHSFLLILSTILASACHLISPSSGADIDFYALSFQDGETVRWQPQGKEDLVVWELPPDAYRFVVQVSDSGKANRVLFMGQDGRYVSYNIKESTSKDLSPDGRYLVDLTDGTLSIKRVDQANWQAIGHNNRGHHAWSFAGSHLLFTTKTDNLTQVVWYETQSDQQKTIVETEDNVRLLNWSPDGRNLALTIRSEGADTVYQYAADDQTLLSADPSPIRELTSLWYLPDGRSLLAMGRQDGMWQIYRFYNDGSSVTPFFQTDGGIRSWQNSPDGQWVLLEVERWQTQENFVTLSLVSTTDGTASAAKIEASLSRLLKAEFSPDGQTIGLLIGPNAPQTGADGLWVWDTAVADSIPQLLIPQNGMPNPVWAGESSNEYLGYAGVSNFTWSPDSNSLYLTAAFADDCEAESKISLELVPHREAQINCRYNLYQVNADGTNLNQIDKAQEPVTNGTRSHIFWLP